MNRLTAFRLFFSIAALLFIAKPFFGFETFNRQSQPGNTHTILVKSFSKRKPEGIEEADANVRLIHQLLANPFFFVLSSISILILMLFPLILKVGNKITDWFLFNIRYGLLQPQPAYLLTGKLII